MKSSHEHEKQQRGTRVLQQQQQRRQRQHRSDCSSLTSKTNPRELARTSSPPPVIRHEVFCRNLNLFSRGGTGRAKPPNPRYNGGALYRKSGKTPLPGDTHNYHNARWSTNTHHILRYKFTQLPFSLPHSITNRFLLVTWACV